MHTPEPWTNHGGNQLTIEGAFTPPHGAIGFIKDETRAVVAVCQGYQRSVEERLSNAKRIVACVNALAGVPTDTLEQFQPGILAGLIEVVQRPEVAQQITALREQRDALLASCEELVADLIKHAAYGLNEPEIAMLKRCEAAIKKAKEEATRE